MPHKVLLVEDDLSLQMTVGDRLRSEGYEVHTAADGAEGLRRAEAEPFDLLLVDVMLPLKSGFDVCRELRRHDCRVPILMLTARGQTVDKVAGLKLGADDYLTKPFDMLELLARIEALLRRSAAPSARAGGIHRFGAIQIDFRKTEVLRGGRPVSLLAKEFELLRYFVEHPGETLSREELLTRVWGYGVAPSTRTVDVHVL